MTKKRRTTVNNRNRSRSKAQERRLAKWLGARRTPLSGGASGHTRGDVIDSELYVEAKGASGSSGTNGWVWRFIAGLDGKEYTVLDVANQTTAELVHSSVILEDNEGEPIVSPPGLCRLWADTIAKARIEEKQPVISLFIKGRQGWWVYGDTEAMKIMRERRRKAEAIG